MPLTVTICFIRVDYLDFPFFDKGKGLFFVCRVGKKMKEICQCVAICGALIEGGGQRQAGH